MEQPVEEKKHYTPEEYFALLEASEEKFEYHDGEVFMMAGGTPRHSVVSLNVARRVLEGLDDKDCTGYSSDMKVDIDRYRRYLFPDMTVVCGPPELTEGRNDTIKNPVLIVEVLSPSTEGYDRGMKFKMYRSLPSLCEYVLVSQDEPLVEVFFKQDDQSWLYQVSSGLEASVMLSSLDHTIALRNIYQKVDFSAPAEAAGRD